MAAGDDDAAARRARRAAIRRHHPDIGGDADALIDALARCDAHAPITVVPTLRGRVGRLLRSRRRHARRSAPLR